MSEDHNDMNSLEATTSFEEKLNSMLALNFTLRLLQNGRYRWVRLSVVFSVIYFGIGIAIAVGTNSLAIFLIPREVIVRLALLSTIILWAIVASWYPHALRNVLTTIPQSFIVGMVPKNIKLAGNFLAKKAIKVETSTSFLSAYCAKPRRKRSRNRVLE